MNEKDVKLLEHNPNSIPKSKGQFPHPLTREERVRGGSATSPEKIMSSRLNGLLADKKLTDDQRAIIVMLKTNNYKEALSELFLQLIKNYKSEKNIKWVTDRMLKMMPEQVWIHNTSDDKSGKVTMKDLIGEMARRHKEEIDNKEDAVNVIDDNK